jgi:hypothetical protein
MMRSTRLLTLALEVPIACQDQTQLLEHHFVLQDSTVPQTQLTPPLLLLEPSPLRLDQHLPSTAIQGSSLFDLSLNPAYLVQMEWNAPVQEPTGLSSALLEPSEQLDQQMCVRTVHLGRSLLIEESKTSQNAMFAPKDESAINME